MFMLTLRKLLISLFCVLNILTVVVANQPPSFERLKADWLARYLTPHGGYRFRYGEWLVRRYAHLVGLDNRWMMFSSLHRFDWWYVIKARHADGSEEVLPLPLQSQRSLPQRLFADFKEAKFHLNIYDAPDLRRAYGRYLCRTSAEHGGRKPVFVVFELHHQMIRERAQAAALGAHLEPRSYSRVLQVIECAWARSKEPGATP